MTKKIKYGKSLNLHCAAIFFSPTVTNMSFHQFPLDSKLRKRLNFPPFLLQGSLAYSLLVFEAKSGNAKVTLVLVTAHSVPTLVQDMKNFSEMYYIL